MESRRWLPKLVGTLGVLTVLALPAQAQVYDNGPPNGVNGHEMTEFIQAEDFVLGAPTNLTAVRFWGIVCGINVCGLTPGFSGQVFWQIYDDLTGSPGSVLFSGLVTPTQVFRAAVSLGNSYQFDFAFAPGLLAPGTYWLGLHNGPLTTTSRAEFYYEFTNPNLTSTGRQDQAPFDGGWFDNNAQHAFQLYAGQTSVIPEPATVGLLATGLLGMALAGFARRRR